MPQAAASADYDAPTQGAVSFSITDLCEEFGVTPRALRFYEDEGLIAPERHGLSRIYSGRDRARLAWILRGKRVGFSLADIREMIDLYDKEKCRARIGLLAKQKHDIDAAIAELERFVDKVETAGD
jgi:DNA-binding transcriptional MerR regulator